MGVGVCRGEQLLGSRSSSERGDIGTHRQSGTGLGRGSKLRGGSPRILGNTGTLKRDQWSGPGAWELAKVRER